MLIFVYVNPYAETDDMRWDAVRPECGHVVASGLTWEDVLEMESIEEQENIDCWTCDDRSRAQSQAFDKYAQNRSIGGNE